MMGSVLQSLRSKGSPLLGTVRRRQRGMSSLLSNPLLPPLMTLALGTLLATLCYRMLLTPQIPTRLEEAEWEGDADSGWGEELREPEEPQGSGEPRGKKSAVGASRASSQRKRPVSHGGMPDGDSNEDQIRPKAGESLPFAPRTTILSGPAKFSNDERPIMKFSADRAGCSFEIQLDGSKWLKASSPLRFKQQLADGNHTFKVRAIDTSGTKDPNPAKLLWTVDTQLPEATVLSHPPALTHEGNVRFEVEASEEGCKFPFHLEYRHDASQGWLSSDSGIRGAGGIGHTDGVLAEVLTSRRIRLTVKGLLEGQHRMLITASDRAGNEGQEVQWEWEVDRTPPKTQIKQAPKKFTKSTVAVFAISATGVEDGWTYQYKMNDDNGWTMGPTSTRSEQHGGAYQLTLKELMEGPQTFSARAVDRAGNVDKEGATFQWTIHDKPADTLILSGPKKLSNQRFATFTISSSETQFSYAYRLDGGEVRRPNGLQLALAAAVFNVTDVGEGNHTIMIRATDVTGGEDPSPAVYRWYVDLTPPTVRILNQPTRVSLDTNAVFGVEADEPYSLTYRLDSGQWQNSDGSILRSVTSQGAATYEAKVLHGPVRFKMTGLREGRHQLLLNITDEVGNTNSMEPIVWVVDFGPPSTKIEKSPPQQTKSKKATFVVSATEPDCIIQYRVDRKAWRDPGKEPGIVKGHPLPGRDDTSAITLDVWAGTGFHVIEFRAKDASGNVDGKPAAFEWVTF